MEENYLIVNIGSTSKKYALYKGNALKLSAGFEKQRLNFVFSILFNGKANKSVISKADFVQATDYILQTLQRKNLIKNQQDIARVGLRVVAPGSFFVSNSPVTRRYLLKLRQTQQHAPLHIKPVITEIGKLGELLPGIPIAGISDSAFHASLPVYTRRYGIANSDTNKFDIFRFGYHGISAQSIMRKVKHLIGQTPKRTIICHLGGGSSITAVSNGKSLDTSMGFTPLEGLLMGTRSGDIDAGAAIYFANKNKMGLEELEGYLNSKSGLLGISGRTSDVRELLNLEKEGHNKAKLALEIYTYRIKKYIGSYIAALNGLDLIVFSAAIGERSSIMRSRICKHLDYLRIKLDELKNKQMLSRDGFIHHASAQVKIAVIITDEMGEIARQARRLEFI